jgi:nitrite reductase/ring-hydroxylating ferredoxin subunit/DMSO/TMAO reductase YedYZ heme-binding membrane subunit
MSAGYSAIGWSRPKVVYDLIMGVLILLYVAAFFVISKLAHSGEHQISDEILTIRATGSCAMTMLAVTLAIGPAARLWPRLAPVLYNRRHLGVLTFLVALTHATIVTGYYHGFGVLNPLRSLLVSNTRLTSFRDFPFELLGLGALAILALMAVTSHDFWLKNLGARNWKRLHMGVYLAFALVVAHVALGTLQSEESTLPAWLIAATTLALGALHLRAGRIETRADRAPSAHTDGWLDAGPIEQIPESRAKVVCAPDGERIAIFKYDGKVSAVTNVCAHQGGPLGEGKVIDGCITCPWHGWQYRPRDGCAPPPFVEKIRTYRVRVRAGRVEVDPKALPPGTPVTPASDREDTDA